MNARHRSNTPVVSQFEKERLEEDRMERQFLERERLRIEYERRREQERIMRERDELRRQQEQLRYEQERRNVKRPFDMDGRSVVRLVKLSWWLHRCSWLLPQRLDSSLESWFFFFLLFSAPASEKTTGPTNAWPWTTDATDAQTFPDRSATRTSTTEIGAVTRTTWGWTGATTLGAWGRTETGR